MLTYEYGDIALKKLLLLEEIELVLFLLVLEEVSCRADLRVCNHWYVFKLSALELLL